MFFVESIVESAAEQVEVDIAGITPAEEVRQPRQGVRSRSIRYGDRSSNR